MKPSNISIIVPAFNEEEVIGSVVKSIHSAFPNSEIIVVNDGSTDNTAVEISGSSVIILNHDLNRGYGAALKTGISKSQNECIVITDADGTYPNERIPELIKIFQEGNYDMVVGARIGNKVCPFGKPE